MTAEIAIINRAAVTLASDSATTITVRGARKIYTSADKIFEVSSATAIGLMIYNNLEFLGLPLDVAIKHFRELHASKKKPFPQVAAAAKEFLEFLEHGLPASADVQMSHVRTLVAVSYRGVLENFYRNVTRWEEKRRRRVPDYPEIFAATVQEEISYLESEPITDSLKDLKPENVLDTYLQAINEEIKAVFGTMPLEDRHRDLLRRLAVAVLLRDVFSDSSTGLVFAGFGANELFPSIYAFEVDGVICGRIKCRTTDKVEMSRDEIGAKVLPFAQREMADRFLDGIDPEFEDGISNYMRKVISATGNQIISITPRQSKKTKGELRQKLAEAVNLAIRLWQEQGLPQIKEKFRQQIEDMALFMPKPELASLAEAMVNLTSVKRKYSRGEEESVGGPVDVAVISKNEGFVWVKRKHYFDSKLNPRYFHRKFGDAHARS